MSHLAALDAMMQVLAGGSDARRATAILTPAKRAHCDVCRKRLDRRGVINDCTRTDCPCLKDQAA